LVKIAVCIRRTPDTTAKITIAAGGKGIDESQVKFVPNPYDEYAVEAALTLAAENPGSETVVIALGPDSVQETMRTALAMGIDRAVHLQGTPSNDGLANARVLADHLRSGDYDLILCGKLAVDDYGQQTGPMIAELLGIPCATAITSLKLENGTATVEREIEGGTESATCVLPALFTTDKGLNNPRLPGVKGILAAKKKPFEVIPVEVGAAQATVVSLALPPERPAGRIIGEGAAAVPALIDALKNEAKVL
jgi:electron transfer flavoprotein beta subunit